MQMYTYTDIHSYTFIHKNFCRLSYLGISYFSYATILRPLMPFCSPFICGIPLGKHCNTLQHTPTHCNTLQHTATHCKTLQHSATLGNTLQHAAPYCNTSAMSCYRNECFGNCNTLQHHCNTTATPLQLTATSCNTLQHTATYCITSAMSHYGSECLVNATLCNTLQHTATHCNTLQHTATRKDPARSVSRLVQKNHTQIELLCKRAQQIERCDA